MEALGAALLRVVALARQYGWWFLLAGGIIAVVGLVSHVGPARLMEVLVQAGPMIPVIVALDLTWMALESAGLLLFYGPNRKHIPVRTWVRSLATHYVTMSILPVGRVGAEVARATMLAPYVGSQRVTAGAAQMQVMVLVCNALISLPCFYFTGLAAGWWHALPLLLVGNFFANGLLGLGLHLFTRNVRIGDWLSRRFERMVHWGPGLDEVLRQGPWFPVTPALFCLAGRSAQVLQYGLALGAVGGVFSFAGTFVSEGIHLTAAALGDMVPNQLGVAEGMYRLFSESLGLAAHPERALAIPILFRLVNFINVALCFVILQIWREERTAPAVAGQPLAVAGAAVAEASKPEQP